MICRVCDATDFEPVIDLGRQPWCGQFLRKEEIGTEPYFPLQVVYCLRCHTAQLDYTVPKEMMFSDHTYLSGITRSLDDHFRNTAAEVDRRFFHEEKAKSVLDIGSNDGTQLKHYKAMGYDVVGVEPSRGIARTASEAGIHTVCDFFNLELARRLGRKFNVINASGVFFHLEELHSVTEGIRESLREDGVFVIQFLYMKSIIENVAFDQIYHEHLLYYTLSTINTLLRRHGLELFDGYFSPIHGGSIVAYATHVGRCPPANRLSQMVLAEEQAGTNELETYRTFDAAIRQSRVMNMEFLEGLKKKGKRIFGFGAPAKGNTLLNYFKIDTRHLDCLVEKNALRKGLYAPGSHIQVVMEDELTAPPDVYYVLAWNFKKEILAKNSTLVAQGVDFHFPVNPPEQTSATGPA